LTEEKARGLRTFALIDNMQPQFAALVGSVARGDTPVAGMAELWVELAPGSDVYPALDAALKATDVRPGWLMVEREFGQIEVHSASVGDVREAGRVLLGHFGLTAADALAPRVVSDTVVTSVSPYEAQLINRARHGSLVVAGQALFILEVEPAGYIVVAANEAEKASSITLVDFDPVGKYGRLFVSGSVSHVEAARQAALTAIESLASRGRRDSGPPVG